jgi:hypothetical protein
MKLRNMMAEVFLAGITQKVKLGLIGPQDPPSGPTQCNPNDAFSTKSVRSCSRRVAVNSACNRAPAGRGRSCPLSASSLFILAVRGSFKVAPLTGVHRRVAIIPAPGS